MELNKLVASRIREFREYRNISQKALAHKLRISISAYSRLESGNVQITLNILEKIANELSIPMSKIINIVTQEKKTKPY